MQDISEDIDPECNFFLNVNDNCSYYSEDQFINNIKLDQSISIIHFNSRSLYANFSNIKAYLRQFNTPFNIIAISETWLSLERGVDFEMEGYDLNFVNRSNKDRGAGLYVDNRLKYKIVESLTAAVDNVCECVTVEISMETFKNCMEEKFRRD